VSTRVDATAALRLQSKHALRNEAPALRNEAHALRNKARALAGCVPSRVTSA
jgi:hypothetical protein